MMMKTHWITRAAQLLEGQRQQLSSSSQQQQLLQGCMEGGIRLLATASLLNDSLLVSVLLYSLTQALHLKNMIFSLMLI